MSIHFRRSALTRLLANLHQVDYSTQLSKISPTLAAPSIPLAEQNGGLRKIDLADPTVPVQVLIRAYPTMLINDRVELFWENQYVDARLVTQEHSDLGSMTFNVLAGMIEDGTPAVQYRVTSAVGGNVRVSHPLNIRVKTLVPGNPDPDPSTPYTNEHLLAVSGLPALINDANADSIEVVIDAYLNMTAGDRLTLSWGGERVTQVVTAAQVGQAMHLPVPRGMIEAAGPGDDLVVVYEIRDVVNNWSLWSVAAKVNVDVGPGLLRQPDALDADNGVIDLETLKDADTRVRVRVYPQHSTGDRVTVTWRGQSAEGTVVEETPAPVDINDDNYGLAPEFLISNATVRASAGGTAHIRYTVTNASTTRSSRRENVIIEGEIVKLPAPSVEGNNGGILDPGLVADTGVPVTVAAYNGMEAGDRVELFWQGTNAEGEPTSFNEVRNILSGMIGNPVSFTVPSAQATVLAGGHLRVFYRVFDGGGQVRESQVLPLAVADALGNLPAPSVDKREADGSLNPDSVMTGTGADVPNYPGKAVGDSLYLTWRGLVGATFVGHINVTEANLAEPIRFHIDYTPYIIGNLNTEVDVRYHVARASGERAWSAIERMAIRRPVENEYPQPTVVEASNTGTGPLDPMAVQTGATVRVTYDGMLPSDVIAVIWSGPSSAGSIETEQKNGSFSGTVDFRIPARVVAGSLDSPVSVAYGMLRGGQAVLSAPLQLQVQALPDASLEASRPRIDQQQDNLLDLNTFVGDVSVRVAPWPLITQGQPVWLTAESNLLKRVLLNGQALTAAQESTGVVVSLDRNYLERLDDGAPLTLTCKVGFDQRPQEAAARVLPVRTLTMVAEVVGTLRFANTPYLVEQGGPLKTVEILRRDNADAPMPGSKITLTLPSGLTYADGSSGDKQFTSDAQGRVQVAGIKAVASVAPNLYALRARDGSVEATAQLRVLPVAMIARIALPGNPPNFVEFLPDGRHAYVASYTGSKVLVIDTRTLAVVNEVANVTTASSISVSPDGRLAYSALGVHHRVAVIDARSHSRIATLSGSQRNPVGIAFAPNGARAYVANQTISAEHGAHTIEVFNTQTHERIGTINVGLHPRQIAFSPDGAYAYVTNHSDHTVSVIDTQTETVIRTIAGFNGPVGVKVTPDGTRVYVVNRLGHSVSIIDTLTHVVIGTITGLNFPEVVAFSPDGARAYVNSRGGLSVWVIDVGTQTLLWIIGTGYIPTDVAVSPDGRRLYVTHNAEYCLSVIDTQVDVRAALDAPDAGGR